MRNKFSFVWDSSLRGRSIGLKNQRMEARYLPVSPIGLTHGVSDLN